MAIVARKKVIEERRQKQNKVGGTPTLISGGWRSIIATLLALLLLCGNPAVLSAAINWTPKDISTGITTPVPEAGNQGPKTQTENMLADMPLFFIENRGQIDKQVLYYTEGGNQGLYFTPSGLTFTLTKSQTPSNNNTGPGALNEFASQTTKQERWAVKLNFIGANKVKPYGEALTPTRVSYFKGQPEDWKAGLNTYSRIVYPDLWPGIDLVFKGDSNGLKYEFVVAPGADPRQIKLAWQGAGRIKINKQGGMEIDTPIGSFTDQTPLVWQGEGVSRQTVKADYCLSSPEAGNYVWGFQLGSYDPTVQLIIDPAIDYSGYIGGSAHDNGYGIAVDSSGRAYATGITMSGDFPVSGGPYTTYANNGDTFVACIKADGTALEYCGFIGGSADDYGYGIAVDSIGRAYVTGMTYSPDFPVTVGWPYPNLLGGKDAFVARVKADGSALDYCGYIGGTELDAANGIAVDDNGLAYVTGETQSSDFPVTNNGPGSAYNGGYSDGFVVRVKANGSGFDYSGYIGGELRDYPKGIAVDSSGRAYVTGMTCSAHFPITGEWPYNSLNGNQDAFLVRVNANGNALDYSGYIGGSGYDIGNSIAVEDSGRAYVTGETLSSDFPVTNNGPDNTYNGGNSDGFVARVNDDGSALEYCGYIGGSSTDSCHGIAVDGNGQAYITGETLSSDFPITYWPDGVYKGGYSDAFVSRVKYDGSGLDYSGCIGGSAGEDGLGIAVDNSGRAYVAGETESTDYPVSSGWPDTDVSGHFDAFVTRVLPPGNQHDILAFYLPKQIGPTDIDRTNHTVVVRMAEAAILNSLVPTITVSPWATINPPSGMAQNFSTPITYTVTAEDGTSQVWTVKVVDHGPDLEVVLSNPPAELGAGAKTSLKAIVTNRGDESSAKAVLNFYIGDQVLASKNVGKLKPGKNKTVKASIKVPAIAADKIRVELVPSIPEEFTGNNQYEAPVTIRFPDLAINSASSKELIASKSATINIEIANQSIAAAGKFIVRVSLHNKPLGEKNVSCLKPGTKKLSVKVNLPADFDPAMDSLTIVIDADNQVAEENEANNVMRYLPY
ncbi:MAG: SBBP repeat-containing protein [Chitinophagales bacterium]